MPGRGVRVQPGGDAAPVGEEGELFRPGGVQSQRDLRAAANVRTNFFRKNYDSYIDWSKRLSAGLAIIMMEDR